MNDTTEKKRKHDPHYDNKQYVVTVMIILTMMLMLINMILTFWQWGCEDDDHGNQNNENGIKNANDNNDMLILEWYDMHIICIYIRLW